MVESLIPTGPYVGVATFCERTLRESDSVISILRVVDQLNIEAKGPDPPTQMPPTPVNLHIVIVIRRGQAKGRHRIQIRPEAPGGEQRDIAIDEFINLKGDEESGANIDIDFTGFPVDQEGLWWFDVLFGDSEMLFARIPLRVNYHPQRVAG